MAILCMQHINDAHSLHKNHQNIELELARQLIVVSTI